MTLKVGLPLSMTTELAVECRNARELHVFETRLDTIDRAGCSQGGIILEIHNRFVLLSLQWQLGNIF